MTEDENDSLEFVRWLSGFPQVLVIEGDDLHTKIAKGMIQYALIKNWQNRKKESAS